MVVVSKLNCFPLVYLCEVWVKLAQRILASSNSHKACKIIREREREREENERKNKELY
jgi:hypothetical protein